MDIIPKLIAHLALLSLGIWLFGFYRPTRRKGTGIREVPRMKGRDPHSGLVFLQHCAIAPSGEVLFPDKQGIIQHQGVSYRLIP